MTAAPEGLVAELNVPPPALTFHATPAPSFVVAVMARDCEVVIAARTGATEIVIAGPTESATLPIAFICGGLAESVTWIPSVLEPDAVGVPEIAPVEAFKDRPEGRVPLVIFQESGGVPPAAASVVEYSTFTVAAGREVVVIVRAATDEDDDDDDDDEDDDDEDDDDEVEDEEDETADDDGEVEDDDDVTDFETGSDPLPPHAGSIAAHASIPAISTGAMSPWKWDRRSTRTGVSGRRAQTRSPFMRASSSARILLALGDEPNHIEPTLTSKLYTHAFASADGRFALREQASA